MSMVLNAPPMEIYECDLTRVDLEEYIINPYKEAKQFYFSGQFVDPFHIKIQIVRTKDPLEFRSRILDYRDTVHNDEEIRRRGLTQVEVNEIILSLSAFERELRKNDITREFIASSLLPVKEIEQNR
jgi:hypothetical protein